ncbi:hypothetical protein JCM10908_000941 [Rhodotorula pacifica]|uniref:uncharacterized protein n=1 Tax=Rhodotorula pacifica TaxID=1495444 RepID=UPI003179BA96
MAPAMSLAVASASRSEPKPTIRASKEWVVPPRPKPGRKSAKAAADELKPTAKTTQKAFRERRQEYVTELEEKVRQLEAGEGEKCVFYQQQAQKAKSEAFALQQENAKLRQELEALRAELANARLPNPSVGRGKARVAPAEFGDSVAPAPAKRRRRAPSTASRAPSFASSSASPPKEYSAAIAEHANASSPVAHPTHSPLSDPQPGAPLSPNQSISLQIPRCTFCSTGPDCFCAQVGFDIAQTPTASTVEDPSPRLASGLDAGPVQRSKEEDPYAAEMTYEPAVPLRLRRAGTKKPKTVWALEPAVTGAARLIDAAKAVCSGDPSNCPACSDDPFGKAFCNALSSSVCSTQPCANCPAKHSSRRIPTPPPEQPIDEGMALLESLTCLPCCGDPSLCGSKTCKTEEHEEILPPVTSPGSPDAVETVPCNEAWSALKQHPNIAFADLQMLAEVVAKRTFCKGAVTETPPPPAGVVSETFPAANRDPSKLAQFYTPENTRRRLTVERGAVNEALGILDRAVAPTGNSFPPPYIENTRS